MKKNTYDLEKINTMFTETKEYIIAEQIKNNRLQQLCEDFNTAMNEFPTADPIKYCEYVHKSLSELREQTSNNPVEDLYENINKAMDYLETQITSLYSDFKKETALIPYFNKLDFAIQHDKLPDKNIETIPIPIPMDKKHPPAVKKNQNDSSGTN